MSTRCFDGNGIGFLVAFVLIAKSSIAESTNEPELNRSPRLAALARELQAGNGPALANFWNELDGKAPLIERTGTNEGQRRLTFLWRADGKTTRVTMMGGLPSPNILKPLARLENTDLWYLSEIHSAEARFQYVFHINGSEEVRMEHAAIMKEMQGNPPRRDALNPREYAGWSYVELPNAPQQPWISKQTGVPARRKTDQQFKSEILKAEYRLSIYTPPEYDQNARRCWLMIAFDGGFRSMDATLNNLLAAEKIPPLVVVGVQNISGETRMRDLNCSPAFARFLAEELTPWARKNYRVHDDAAHTIVGGTSLGGKMAAYCGLKYSGVFGKVLSQSGSFLTAAGQESPTALWEGEAPGMLAVQFARSPRLALEFYIEVGRYETALPFSHLLETRRLRDVLEAKGYRVSYSEYVGGHNEVCWRGSFADAIMALTAKR